MSPQFNLTAALAENRLLHGLDEQAVAAIGAKGRLHEMKPKEVLFEIGSIGSDLFLILDGGVSISTLSCEGKEITFDVLAADDFFGEMSLFDGKQRTGTVTALVPTVLFVLSKQSLLQLLEQYSLLTIRLIETLVSRLRVMDELMEDVFFLDAESRLARRILALARLFGRTGAQGEVRIDLRMSQQELASLVGITRESVNKCFRQWERKGQIALDQGYLVLCNAGEFKAAFSD